MDLVFIKSYIFVSITAYVEPRKEDPLPTTVKRCAALPVDKMRHN
jgi:hypothetical protein